MVLDDVSFFYATGQKLIIYFLLCHTDFLYFLTELSQVGENGACPPNSNGSIHPLLR